MENNQDFVIENGFLKEYKGPGGEVTIPEGVTRIGRNAFYNCTSLTSVTIPESVTEIGSGAFMICKSLTNVTIPEGVTEIGWGAFSGCTSLQSVTIPESVKKIGDIAFSGCTSLTSVTILAGWETVDKYLFKDSRPVLVAPHIPIANFDKEDKPGACIGFAKQYMDGAELDGEIKAGYFKYIKGQKKRLFPVAVQHEELLRVMLSEKMLTHKDIDPLLEECDKQNNIAAKAAVLDYAGKSLQPVDPFDEMEKELAKAERVASHLEKTGSLPMGELKKLWSWETVDTKEGTTITLTSWKGKDGPHVTMPAKIGEDPVKAIGESAFSPEGKPKAIREARKALQSVTIPESVIEIGDGAFSGCTSLQSVTIPESVKKIGGIAFSRCTSLTSVTIPAGVTEIGLNAFSGCANLTSVTIPESVTEIGSGAFMICKSLTSVTILEGVTEIGWQAFGGCETLTIHAPAGSAAEQYARDNGIKFETTAT